MAMWFQALSKVIGQYLFYFALLLCVPLGVAGYYEIYAVPESHLQPHSTWAFAFTIFITLALSAILYLIGYRAKGTLFRREALALVVLIWFISAIIGGLPFYFSGTFENFIDCYFEAMSGLTTTGASVMHPKAYDPQTGLEIMNHIAINWGHVTYDFFGTITPVRDTVSGEIVLSGIESVSKGILFWRSFLQWLGGMGIVVLFIAVLPALGVGGKVLYHAEVPGPVKESVTPRIKETASILWKLYLGVTIAEIFLLVKTNESLPLFDAFCITFSNLSTGGFSVTSASIGGYENIATEWVVIAFMLIGSTNFALYFHCLKGKIYRLYEPEFITYYLSILFGSGLMIWHLYGTNKSLLTGATGIFSWEESIRYGIFHLVSAQTSTGFVTANFDAWPYVTQVYLLLVMFVGSMSGSTGGGIKIVRFYMLFHIARNKVESIFRPEAVRAFQIGSKEIDSSAAITVLSFFFIVMSIAVGSTLFLVADGIDPETSLSVIACMINNIGIAFRAAGPTESFAFLSSFGKILSTLLMVLGRLEFFALLVVLIPAFWSEK
jgi:trk system potassium uptake protein